MPFNTLGYFLFLPVVFLAHYFSPDRFRCLVLLIASFVFYAGLKAPHLIAVLLIVTTITYFAGIWIERTENQKARKYLLWGGISANISTLVCLKYLPFISQNLNDIFNYFLPGTTVPVSKAIIAIGASYFIFQAISYLVDIYLEVEKPEKHFGYFALYLSFFPKVLQGPIERSGDLLPQIKRTYTLAYDNVRLGLMMLLWGIFKKAVIADRLAFIVNPIFDNVHNYSGLPFILATYCYSLQIFCDFSGYTDMALGSALIFNIKLTQNFKSPYLATSIADFWRRWHISFSRWLFDYIFRPLQMYFRQWQNAGSAVALIITFIVSGLWHGANWGYVIWGLIHGIYLATAIYTKPYQARFVKSINLQGSMVITIINCFITFNLVSFAWIFFRANSVTDAIYIVNKISKINEYNFNDVFNCFHGIYQGTFTLILSIVMVTLLSILSIFKNKNNILQCNGFIRWFVYIALGYGLLLFGVFSMDPSFIYFRY